MDKFDLFINNNANIQVAQYTASRQKEIARRREKDIFKFNTTKNILNNAQIFNSCFINEIKCPDTDKTYVKS